MSQTIIARHLKYISIYQGLQTKKLYSSFKLNCIRKWQKNMNWICPMTANLNFMICGKMVSFTAWHTAEMDSAQTFHIESTNEVLFLKNAYRSLSRAIFQFFVLTIITHSLISIFQIYVEAIHSISVPFIPMHHSFLISIYLWRWCRRYM